MENKNVIEQIKGLLVKYGFLQEDQPEYNSFKLVDNTIIQVIGEMEVEKEIFSIDEATGERVVLANGNYKTDVKKFEVVDGKIVQITERFEEVKTADGGVLKIDGMTVGASVMVVTETDEMPAPDGVYELEDGTKLTVKDGVIESIGEKEPEVEVEPAPEPMENESLKELFDLLKTFVESVNQKLTALESKFDAKFSDIHAEFNAFKKEPDGKKIPDGKIEQFENNNSKLEMIMSLRNKK